MPQAALTVVWRATQRPRDIRHELGKPKVGHLDVSVGAKQQVFGLEVAVDDVERVKVVEGECDLGRVEFGDRVGEALCEGKAVLVNRYERVLGFRRQGEGDHT